ncbi:MAG: alpha/beta hydrolase [Eubacterium sp.]|nr:alpha/beta hydrolase [Eubacterium sp.]
MIMTINEKIWQDGEYSYRAAYGFVPSIRGYIHDDDEMRDCMVVVPGGGYCMCVPHEGELPAKVFFEQGMNVFVLTYSTDITMSVPLMRQPLNDISRAVRFIRKRADEYKIADKKLFICGFSAGAHVCGSLAVHYDDVEDVNPEYAGVSNRPDGAILSYPVISSSDHAHIYSFQTLLGKNADPAELEYFSLEKNVTPDTPPCFIWQTATDDLVPVENSYLMAEAMRKAGVNYAHYVFPKGIHGLSVANEEMINGWTGEEYTFDQLWRAVDAVKKGEAIDVSPERIAELKAQFPDEPTEQEPMENPFDKTLIEDVGCWPELARVWMSRL